MTPSDLLAVGLLAVAAAVVLFVAGLVFLDDFLEPSVKFFRWQIDPDWPAGLLISGGAILGVMGLAAIGAAGRRRSDSQ
jgi:hypothetical protein